VFNKPIQALFYATLCIPMLAQGSKPIAGQVWKDQTSGIEFCYCPPGSFLMGIAESIPYQSSLLAPQHRVVITKGFWLGRTPVTLNQWKKWKGTPGSGDGNHDESPVTQVSWLDCQAFLMRLNQEAGEDVYRLPTEAEWEYACNAGQPIPNFSEIGIDEFAVKYSCSRLAETPNAWNLSAMLGFRQWCSDWRGPYPAGVITDPKGPESGSYRINRGGNRGLTPCYTHPTYRWYYTPDFKDDDLGFRVVRVVD
jgi:formylglycine-generating enzyme required for sulfatase activity